MRPTDFALPVVDVEPVQASAEATLLGSGDPADVVGAGDVEAEVAAQPEPGRLGHDQRAGVGRVLDPEPVGPGR